MARRLRAVVAQHLERPAPGDQLKKGIGAEGRTGDHVGHGRDPVQPRSAQGIFVTFRPQGGDDLVPGFGQGLGEPHAAE